MATFASSASSSAFIFRNKAKESRNNGLNAVETMKLGSTTLQANRFIHFAGTFLNVIILLFLVTSNFENIYISPVRLLCKFEKYNFAHI